MKADTSRQRSTTQNKCFLISISAVTLKLMVKITSILGRYFLTFRSLYSKLEFVYQCISPVVLRSRRENAHLLVNPIPKVTIVLIWKTPACLKCGKTSNGAVKNFVTKTLESGQRTLHVLIRIWSHRTSASVCFFGNDKSSHSRIRISLDLMSVYYEWASD